MGYLASKFGPSQIEFRLCERRVAQLLPTVHEQRKGQFGPISTAGCMHNERSSTGTSRQVGTDVVGDSVLLTEAPEEQAGHAGSEMTLQQSQGQIVGMTMGTARLSEGDHHLFGVHPGGGDSGLSLRFPWS